MRDRIPPLAALRAFAAVAREGSFARAAASLHVTTSAISHQVRGLEQDLGAPLLTRARNGAGRSAPTTAGAALLAGIETAFAQLSDACDRVRDGARRTRKQLAISANGSIASLWLGPRLARFAAMHPSVEWQMVAIEITPDLRRDGLDLALVRTRHGTLAEGDRLLFEETVFPVCSPALDLKGGARTLTRYNLLQEWVEASPEKEWSTWLERLGVAGSPNIVRFSTFNAVIGAAIAGAGIALGRSPLVDLDLASGRLVRPFGTTGLPGSWDVALRARPGAERDGHVGHFARFLLAEGNGGAKP